MPVAKRTKAVRTTKTLSRAAATPPKITQSSPHHRNKIQVPEDVLAEPKTGVDSPPAPQAYTLCHCPRHREVSAYLEEKGGNMFSFVHHHPDSTPFMTFDRRYHAVREKYLKQIFFGTFRAEHLTKLGNSNCYGTDSDDIEDPTDMVDLLRCFEVYCQIVLHYAHPSVFVQLQRDLSSYRIRLMRLSYEYPFGSILRYHYAFMTARMLYGQDDPIAWVTEDYRCAHLLAREPCFEDQTDSETYG